MNAKRLDRKEIQEKLSIFFDCVWKDSLDIQKKSFTTTQQKKPKNIPINSINEYNSALNVSNRSFIRKPNQKTCSPSTIFSISILITYCHNAILLHRKYIERVFEDKN